MHVRIADVAYHLPERVETREDLLRDNPDWKLDAVEAKTGVRTRHVAAEGETVLDLVAQAAEKLFASGLDRGRVGALVLVTTEAQPAAPLQHRLRLPRSCLAFSVDLACSGFVDGLAVGGSLIESGLASDVLLVCGDTWSKFVGPHDRTCRPLFGDGAAAAWLTRSASDDIGPFVLGTDGSGDDMLKVRGEDACAACGRQATRVFMDGAKVFLFTMSEVPTLVLATLEKAHLRLDDVDLFVFHQASKLVLDNIVRRLGLPEAKVVRSYEQYGNTVSATIPIALRDAAGDGRLQPGHRVMLVGFGLGYSWAATIMTWAPGTEGAAHPR